MLAAVALFILACVLGLPPRVDPDLLKLLPDDLPAMRAIRDLGRERIPAGIWITLDGPDEALAQAVPEVAQRLDDLDSIAFTLHGLEPALALHLGLMQLPPEAVEERAHLLDAALLVGRSRPPWMAAKLQTPLEPRENALFPDDGYARIFVRPTLTHHDAKVSTAIVDDVRRTLEDTLPADVEVVYLAGPYVIVADGAAGIRQDLTRTGGLSLLLVLGVVALGMRSLRAPVLVFPPLILAAVAQLALVQALLGALNGQTVMGTAVLFGLGVDFALHLIARTREALADEVELPEAIARAWADVGPVCVFAALTTAAGFSALGFARFGGLSQLGLTLSLGVLLALVCVLVLLPALLMLVGPGRPRSVEQGFSLTISPAVARAGLVVAAMLVLAAGLGAWRFIRFEHDFTAIGRDAFRMDALTEQQRAFTRQAMPPALLRVTDDDRARVQAELRAHLAAGDLPHIRAVFSLDDLLPPDQERRVAALARLKEALGHRNARYLPPDVLEQLHRLDGWEPRVRTRDELPDGLRALLGDGTLVLLPLQGRLNDMRESGKLLDELAEHVPDAASEVALQGALYRMILEDLPWLSGLALLFVGALTALYLRHLGRTVVAVVSLVGGLVVALGALAVLGLPLTLANLVGLPILLGMCVDVVLHLVHRLSRGEPLAVVLRAVGPPALWSTLTTVASFISLSAASTGALRSLGQLVTVGLCVGTLSAAIVVVLLVTATGRPRT